MKPTASRGQPCPELGGHGDSPAPEEHPLLPSNPEEDVLWNDVEEANPSCVTESWVTGPESAGSAAEVEWECSVEELLRERPQHLLAFLQDHGVKCLGAFDIEDRLLLGKLSGDSILTLGSDHAITDYEQAWRRELGACSAKYRGWSAALPVAAYVVAVRGAAYPGMSGLLQPLLRRWQAGGCSYTVFALPAVQAVIDWKWKRFTHRLLLLELAAFLVWLISYCVFLAATQEEDHSMSLPQLLNTGWGTVAVAANLLGLAGAAPFLAIEVRAMAAYGLRGWLTAWNLLSATSITLQVLISLRHLTRTWSGASWLPVAMAVQCVLLPFRSQYFSRVFRPTRFAFVDSLAEVLHDLKYYLVFLVVLIAGFASAFFVLFQQDREHHEEFSSIPKSLITMVAWLAGDPNLTLTYSHSSHPVAAGLLAVTFVFVIGLVLMSLLTSLMTNSLKKVTDDEALRMLLSKAQIIDELESTLPRCMECLARHLYPPYLHVLRVDPSRLDKVELDRLWGGAAHLAAAAADRAAQAAAAQDGAGRVGEQGRGGGGDSASGVKELMGHLTGLEAEQRRLREQVAELKSILLQSLHEG